MTESIKGKNEKKLDIHKEEKLEFSCYHKRNWEKCFGKPNLEGDVNRLQ